MNVFFIFSPLQLINAIEAKEFFATANNVLVVVRDNPLFFPFSVYKPLIEVDEWDSIHYLSITAPESTKEVANPYRFYLRWSLRRRLDTLIASLGRSENLFMGRYSEPIQHHIGNVLAHKTLYLLDDGTDTLLLNETRKQAVEKLQLSVKGTLSLTLLGIQNAQAERVRFFSAYDIKVREGDKLIPNRYQHFRARVAETPVGNEVWFLGQPLAVDGYLARATYLEYLALIKRFYQGRRFVYLLHSREPETDVVELQKVLDCEVRRYDLPIEYVLSTVAERPTEIVSLFTSAIPNCAVMFGKVLKLTSVYLEPQHLLRFHAFVESVYTYFRTNMEATVSVLTLSELSTADRHSYLSKPTGASAIEFKGARDTNEL